MSAEVLLRAVDRKLLPGVHSFTETEGLPSERLARAVRRITRTKPTVVFIGDSFVESGELESSSLLGWVRRMQRAGHPVDSVGFSAACPAQYLLVLDRLRTSGYRGRAVIVIYTGNDFVEQDLWLRLGYDSTAADRSEWMAYRQSIKRPTGEQSEASVQSPCWVSGPRGLERRVAPPPSLLHVLRRGSALYRYSVVARSRAKALLYGRDSAEADLVAFMDRQCDNPPWSERIGGRLFAFRHHEARTDRAQGRVERGWRSTTETIAAADRKGALSVAVVRDREELSRDFHRREVTRTDSFAAELRAAGVDVFDPSPEFSHVAARRDLFLPDGHWNNAGHELFAQLTARWVESRISER